jgi:hypothetical protein
MRVAMPRFIFFVRIGPFVRRELNGSNQDQFHPRSVNPCSKKTWPVTFQRDAANTLAKERGEEGASPLGVKQEKEYRLEVYNV